MTAHVFISGFVQGVGFRQFIKKTAKNLGLSGWTKNLADGRVEAVLAGERKAIEDAINKLWEGTYLSEIKSIDIEWVEDEEEFTEFIVARD